MGTLSYYEMNTDQIVFQHDNNSKHMAQLIQQWLEDYKIEILSWPAQSPDLNPIEHLWSDVKRRLYNLSKKITNKEYLQNQLEKIWNSIEYEIVINLIITMLERIADVIKAKGRYTRQQNSINSYMYIYIYTIFKYYIKIYLIFKEL